MSSTLVVIPTYNEALNIRGLVEALLTHRDLDVMVVDDGSPDGTGAIVEELHREQSQRVRLLTQPKKGGRGAAVLAGFREGVQNEKYHSFLEMDADMSHLPEELPRLLALAGSADVVIGSRYLAEGLIVGWSWRRRLWSRASNWLIDVILRLPVTDYTNGYRLYSRKAVDILLGAQLRERGYISLSEWATLLHRSGLRFANVPTTFVNRRLGKSKMSLSEAVGAMRGLLRLRGMKSQL